jgi:hypothetical protein
LVHTSGGGYSPILEEQAIMYCNLYCKHFFNVPI